jgi:uncharacterized protein
METAWIEGLIGGLLIGTAAAAYLLLSGRIAGMTAILGEAFGRIGTSDGARSGMFLVGAFAAPLVVSAWIHVPMPQVTQSVLALVASGLLVGIGVVLANGCTSGHGICGMSRLSGRSIVATLTFMAMTAVSVAMVRHGLEIAL